MALIFPLFCFVLASFEGYLKNWPQKKHTNDPSSRATLVAIGRRFIVHHEQTDYSQPGQICEFEARQRVDGVFIRVDNRYSLLIIILRANAQNDSH